MTSALFVFTMQEPNWVGLYMFQSSIQNFRPKSSLVLRGYWFYSSVLQNMRILIHKNFTVHNTTEHEDIDLQESHSSQYYRTFTRISQFTILQNIDLQEFHSSQYYRTYNYKRTLESFVFNFFFKNDHNITFW